MYVVHLTALASLLCSTAARGDDGLRADQRAIFMNGWASAERGQWSLTRKEEALLADYILWPDLRARYLETALAREPRKVVDTFLAQHDNPQVVRSLRYRYARHLFKQEDWVAFLALYGRYYATLGNAELDCKAVAAQINANKPINGALALKLWRIGRSQHDSCDPVFDWLDANEMLTTAEIQTRFDLAIDERQFNLARWLAKRLGPREQQTAARWIALRDKPATAVKDLSPRQRPGFADEIIYGIGRLAREDSARAMQTWQTLQKKIQLPTPAAAAATESIALIAAWRFEAHAAEFMDQVPAEHRSLELAQWRARDALRRGDMTRLAKTIDELPADEQTVERWRYWRAVAIADSDAERSTALLSALADERSYYGFLAADRLGRPYALGNDAVTRDPNVMARLAKLPALARALELHAVNLNGRARSAWDRATRKLNASEQRQLALIAAEAGWTSRAIAALARAGDWDDLALRYPTPWRPAFAAAARKNDIDVAWTYGIARSESLFMPDVRSRAGAVGVMQLMPGTGKQTAAAAGIRYEGLATLTDATSNIRIGTHYLAGLARRFGGHEALATAAYNAGPHRVERWLQGARGMPAEIWVESIPFDETRKYVQRVFAARAVFHWRLTDAQRRVSLSLPPISIGAERTAATQP